MARRRCLAFSMAENCRSFISTSEGAQILASLISRTNPHRIDASIILCGASRDCDSDRLAAWCLLVCSQPMINDNDSKACQLCSEDPNILVRDDLCPGARGKNFQPLGVTTRWRR